jgi:hypothetical protein
MIAWGRMTREDVIMRILALALALPILFVAADARSETFTGCLSPSGNLNKVAVGLLPSSPCTGNSQQVTWTTDTLEGRSCADGEAAVFDSGEWVCESDLPRFVDNGDGTITDNYTGLMWEKKTGTVSTPVNCQAVQCPDPHDVNNQYLWSDSGTETNGSLFRDFLAPLNDDATDDPSMTCFANYCDWRIPNVIELQTLLFEPFPCSISPCIIDPIFAPVATLQVYWTSTSFSLDPNFAWITNFGNGFVDIVPKSELIAPRHARAVRGGR